MSQATISYVPSVDEVISVLGVNENFAALANAVNFIDSEQLRPSGNAFPFGNMQLDNIADPGGVWNDSTDLRVAVAKEYLKTALQSVSAGIHTFTNETLLDTLTENTTELATGTVNNATTNKLEDTSKTFVTTDIVRAGQLVYNETEDQYATVTAVDSETFLSVDNDIFTDGDVYKIYPPASVILAASPFLSYSLAPKMKEALDETLGQQYATLGKNNRLATVNDVSGVDVTTYGISFGSIGTPSLLAAIPKTSIAASARFEFATAGTSHGNFHMAVVYDKVTGNAYSIPTGGYLGLWNTTGLTVTVDGTIRSLGDYTVTAVIQCGYSIEDDGTYINIYSDLYGGSGGAASGRLTAILS